MAIKGPDFVISGMICSLSMALRDDSWLSLTPEPERLLPEARAVLRSGLAPPPAALLAAERETAERLVLRARRARWEAWLRESTALATATERSLDGAPADGGAADDDGDAAAAAATVALVRDVVANHDALALGLPRRHRSLG
jgi:hypothetical protein